MTEEIKIAELLKKRYKVTADWPGVAGKVKAGDILHTDDEFINYLYWVAGEPFMEDKLKDYPHLFKPLEWWEDRKIEDLPMYVKNKHEVIKILSWSKGENEWWCKIKFGYELNINQCYKDYLPATELEYLNQIR